MNYQYWSYASTKIKGKDTVDKAPKGATDMPETISSRLLPTIGRAKGSEKPILAN